MIVKIKAAIRLTKHYNKRAFDLKLKSWIKILMVFHYNFLRDPRTTFDISSIASSPNLSPSYSTDSTQSGCSPISKYSLGTSSAFTFPVIQSSASSLLARKASRKSRNRTVSTSSYGIRSRLSSLTKSNQNVGMD